MARPRHCCCSPSRLGLTPWLAILLAVATYAAIVLLRPRPAPDETVDEAHRQHLAFQAALANAEAIRALQARIARPAVREQVGRILDRIAQVLAVIQEDGNLAAAPLFNDHLLAPVRALLTEYVRLSNREISSASELLEKTETHDLPRIERAIDTFYERLHRSHVVDLATLGEMLELNLEQYRHHVVPEVHAMKERQPHTKPHEDTSNGRVTRARGSTEPEACMAVRPPSPSPLRLGRLPARLRQRLGAVLLADRDLGRDRRHGMVA